MKKYIYPLIIISFLTSCSMNNNLSSQVEGQWAIKEITYSGESYKDYLYSNVLIFKEDNVVSIPKTFHFNKDMNAKWTVLKNNKSIVISTKTTVFNDTFDVKFINRTETDPLGMILKSDTIFIKAYKLLDWNY